jgi:hypothetical protein
MNTAVFIMVHQTAINDRRGENEDVGDVNNACWSLSGIVNSRHRRESRALKT